MTKLHNLVRPKWRLALLLIVAVVIAGMSTANSKKGDALASRSNDNNYQRHTPTPSPKPSPTPSRTPAPGETRIMAYTTGYSYFDNTPAGAADISNPVLHSQAGGVGTYADPITLAVGHSIIGGRDILDYAAGTKFYLPNLRRYFIVEDTCGDGATPQNGPCHVGYPAGTTAWVDLWINGQGGSQSATDTCMNKITDGNGEAHLLIKNPASNYTVVKGSIFQNGACSALYGNTLVTN